MKNFVTALTLIMLMTGIIHEVPAKGLYQMMDFIPPREPRIAASTITATLTVTSKFYEFNKSKFLSIVKCLAN